MNVEFFREDLRRLGQAISDEMTRFHPDSMEFIIRRNQLVTLNDVISRLNLHSRPPKDEFEKNPTLSFQRYYFKHNYERYKTLPLEVVIPLIKTPEKTPEDREEWKEYRKRAEENEEILTLENDIKVGLTSVRLQTYKVHGTTCRHCGLAAKHFAVERQIAPKQGFMVAHGPWHLNLYAIHPQSNQEMMMTSDHIIPKSKGGSNSISNRQPLCWKCNMRKGNKYEEEIKK